MRARPLLAIVVGVLGVTALIGAATTASAGRACVGNAREGGYSYAGHQATYRGHGVRATIALTREPAVDAGHVAGWIGVGGPGRGANGQDAWIQIGINSLPGSGNNLYAEAWIPGYGHAYKQLGQVAAGAQVKVSVLELPGRPGWWQAAVNGKRRFLGRSS